MRCIYKNANVITICKDSPKAEAFAVEDGKFIAVGLEKDMLAYKTDSSKVVDLNGATVIPGFNDSHLHLLNFGYAKTKIDLAGITSVEEIVNVSKKYIAEHKIPKGKWVLGRGWSEYFFEGGHLLDKLDLDKISTENPILFTRICEHTVVVNSKALEAIGIDDSTPDPVGGTIQRDCAGHATGILKETARYLAYAKQPDFSVEEIKDMLVNVIDIISDLGITSVQTDDFETFSSKNYHNVIKAYQELEKEGRLKVRVNEQCLLPQIDRLKGFLAEGYKTGVGSPMFKIGPLKLLTDGSIGPKTAFLNEDYSDDPGNRGIHTFTQDELDELVITAHTNGMQVLCHSIGDGAMEMCLSSYEKAQNIRPDSNARSGLLHVQITTKAIMERMKRDNVIAFSEPICVGADMHCVESRVGSQRIKESYNYRTMWDMGIFTALSSDTPVDSVNPIDSAYIATTRKDFNGYPDGGWFPQEKLTIEQVLQGFTLNSAYTSYDEKVKGSIEVGKYADFLILSEDITKTPSDDLRRVKVLKTYLGGKEL